MSIRSKSCLTLFVLTATFSISCGSNKDGESPGAAASHPAATPEAPPLTPGVSQDLKRTTAAPVYVFDSLGPLSYPEQQKSNQFSGDTDAAVSGWAIDDSKKTTAGGVEVVLDQVPYKAHYGLPRGDVASHFNHPDYLNSGFQLVLGRGRLTKGQHSISIRVISSDQKSYGEGPLVKFIVN